MSVLALLGANQAKNLLGGLVGGIGSTLGIKGSFRSAVDWGSSEWLEFHSTVSKLKFANGQPYGDRPTIGQAYRYIKGDYPQPDRDESDRKNREAGARAAQEIADLSNLPINQGGKISALPDKVIPEVGGVRITPGMSPATKLYLAIITVVLIIAVAIVLAVKK